MTLSIIYATALKSIKYFSHIYPFIQNTCRFHLQSLDALRKPYLTPKVIPVYEKLDPLQKENYTPVSLLSNALKISANHIPRIK